MTSVTQKHETRKGVVLRSRVFFRMPTGFISFDHSLSGEKQRARATFLIALADEAGTKTLECSEWLTDANVLVREGDHVIVVINHETLAEAAEEWGPSADYGYTVQLDLSIWP